MKKLQFTVLFISSVLLLSCSKSSKSDIKQVTILCEWSQGKYWTNEYVLDESNNKVIENGKTWDGVFNEEIIKWTVDFKNSTGKYYLNRSTGKLTQHFYDKETKEKHEIKLYDYWDCHKIDSKKI